MIPCDATFDGKNTYEENGRIHYRWYYSKFRGNYTLTFRFISTNSPLHQGVSLFVSGDFKGKMYLNGTELRPLKSTFAHYTFRVDEFPEELSEKHYRFHCNDVDLDDDYDDLIFDIIAEMD